MSQEQTQTLDQTLERTDIGHFINHHKNLVLIGAAVVIIAVFAYALYGHQANKGKQERLDQLYAISLDVAKIMEPLAEQDAKKAQDKLNAEQAQKLLEIVNNIPVEVAKMAATAPMVLDVVTEVERAEAELDVKPVLRKFLKYYSPKESLFYFTGTKLAVLEEDAGNTDAAIEILEKIVAGGHKFLEGKLYVDLGRLYLKKDQKEKAKKNFEYVAQNLKDSEYANIAELYLMEL